MSQTPPTIVRTLNPGSGNQGTNWQASAQHLEFNHVRRRAVVLAQVHDISREESLAVKLLGRGGASLPICLEIELQAY